MSSGQDTARYVEVERKFDVDDWTAAPSFRGIATAGEAVSQSLDAVYFDTPAHDLAARRITLRRRTGGSDAGWHLKLPAGPGVRTEHRAPLGAADDAVPGELL
ncbi:MAG TPA: CYTH domain-containing protein, partial [Mycobacterium sp.]|nr:CYTH domain-containing protein [Mycobacterium sp.]